MKKDQSVVLVVEDEPAQREVLAFNLDAEGYDVVQAANGEEALIMVDEVMPDIIVLDWMMPNLSGIEVCRRLKCAQRRAGYRLSCCLPNQKRLTACEALKQGPTIMSSNPIQLSS